MFETGADLTLSSTLTCESSQASQWLTLCEFNAWVESLHCSYDLGTKCRIFLCRQKIWYNVCRIQNAFIFSSLWLFLWSGCEAIYYEQQVFRKRESAKYEEKSCKTFFWVCSLMNNDRECCKWFAQFVDLFDWNFTCTRNTLSLSAELFRSLFMQICFAECIVSTQLSLFSAVVLRLSLSFLSSVKRLQH